MSFKIKQGWKKVTPYKYVHGRDTIYLDKLDGLWEALLYTDDEDHDADTIASSRNLKELRQEVSAWTKKHKERLQ